MHLYEFDLVCLMSALEQKSCTSLQGSTIRKRKTYEEFLRKVSIFKGMPVSGLCCLFAGEFTSKACRNKVGTV